MAKIRTHIAASRPRHMARLTRMVADAAQLELVGTSTDLPETFTLCEAREPDVILIADEFSRVNEWSTMKSLFQALGTVWIIASDGRMAGGRLDDETMIGPDTTSAGLVGLVLRKMASQRPRAERLQGVAVRHDSDQSPLVVIGASTGGVDALLTILSEFPADCPPTMIVQHTGKGFSDGLIRLLSRRCKPSVVEARNGLHLARGQVCVAAGTNGHLVLKPNGSLECQIRPGEPISGHVPSVDALFQSALQQAPNVVGVILTGMGQDGAEGLLSLARAGCMTIGQDEATSVVYGMPKAAFVRGAVQRQVPIQRISAEIFRACSHLRHNRTARMMSRSAGC